MIALHLYPVFADVFPILGNPIAVINFSSVRVEAFLTVLLINLISSFLRYR